MHLDGARVFNAAAALNVAADALARDVDSVTFCLSKGLCAPVGSVLCGSREFIDGARRIRKVLGGGMRQAGVLAAAGLVALETMTGRLGEDHAHARLLADGLAEIPGIKIKPERVRTNIVHFELDSAAGVGCEGLVRRVHDEHRIRLGAYSSGRLRAVTHYWVGRKEVEALLGALRQVLSTRA
jgi:threonine aldolase